MCEFGPNVADEHRTGLGSACNLHHHQARQGKHLHLGTYLPFSVLISFQGARKLLASPEKSKFSSFFP